jgi:hypothetical protein
MPSHDVKKPPHGGSQAAAFPYGDPGKIRSALSILRRY